MRGDAKVKREKEVGKMADKAKITMTDRKTGYKLKWFGGHGVHAYDGKDEIAFWNTGDFSKENADREDIIQSMKEMIRRGNYEDYM
jgi:hypothetical protein